MKARTTVKGLAGLLTGALLMGAAAATPIGSADTQAPEAFRGDFLILEHPHLLQRQVQLFGERRAALEAQRETPEYWDGFQRDLGELIQDSGTEAAESADIAAGAAQGDGEEGGVTGQILPDLFWPFLQSLAALCFVLGLFLLIAYGLRRMGQRSAIFPKTGLAQVLGRVYLTPRVSLHFVEMAGQVLVIGVGQNDTRLLTQFPAEAFQEHINRAAVGNEQEVNSFRRESELDNDFFAELQARTAAMNARDTAAYGGDADMDAMRDDIQRLRESLRKGSRGNG